MKRALMYGAFGWLLNWCGISAMEEPLKFIVMIGAVILIDLFAE